MCRTVPISRVAGSIRPPELQALGERLAESRRQQGISQEELAERLRLGTDQLDALEQGDLSRLPEPVFVIAQAKRVAGALGINIDAQISALNRSGVMQPPQRGATPIPPPWAPATRDPVDAAAAAGPPGSEPAERPQRQRAWLPVATAAVLIFSVSGVLLFTRQGGGIPADRRLSPPAAAPAPPPAPRP